MYLVSFSAGVFFITAGGLALEVFHLADSFLIGVVLIVLGYILAWGVQYLMPETHHHHDADCGEKKGGARKLIIGDAIHNAADGLVLVTAFSVSSVVGLTALVSIIIHETLQEVSEFFVLKSAGYTTARALSINALVSSTILIGVVFGYFALASEELELILLAVSAGFFMHVVFHDLLPHHAWREDKREFFRHVTLIVVGAVIMGFIAHSLGEDHSHEATGHDESGLEGGQTE